MSENFQYPPIEPTTFDLIIAGTGLQSSIIAAAASATGKSVLHLDPNSFYGSQFASLSLHDLSSFLTSQPSSPHPVPPSSVSSDSNGHILVEISPRSVYSDVEIESFSPDLLEHSRKFNLDLAGPRVLFCADSAIDSVIKSGAFQYVEFKSVDATFICCEDGRLVSVPDSRTAIFKDKNLGLLEKNQLMRFFKLVHGHLAVTEEGGESKSISDEDLESPFVEFLKKMQLPPKIISVIVYALAMADYDQDNLKACKDVLKTKDGIDRLALYHSSAGRFPGALGAMIYPMYGQGELIQAFCRRAAVKGCIYVLRRSLIALLMDENTGQYKGVRLASGEDLFSNQLVLDPSFVLSPSLDSSPPDILQQKLQHLILGDGKAKGMVARGLCITNSSLKPDISCMLLVYPPRSLFPEQATTVRVLQVASNLAVCPSGMFVLYLSAFCDDANQGKKLLRATMKALLTNEACRNTENSSSVESDFKEDFKPSLLWSALFIQKLAIGSFGPVSFTSMPDEHLNYTRVLEETVKLFNEMYPNEELFPETKLENSEDDAVPGEEF